MLWVWRLERHARSELAWQRFLCGPLEWEYESLTTQEGESRSSINQSFGIDADERRDRGEVEVRL